MFQLHTTVDCEGWKQNCP